MNRTDGHLLDLPNEMLFIILNKLNNMNVLYSLIGIGTERLELLAREKIFTNTLNFISTDNDDICSMNNSTLNRFCTDILPRIQYNVECLIFQSTIMERILLVGDYPNLTKLQLFEFNQDVVSRYFTGNSFGIVYQTIDLHESPFRYIFEQQITDLTLINNDKYAEVQTMNYTTNVYARILKLFGNLKNLSVVRACIGECPSLSLDALPSTTFFSSILTKLSINVCLFEDCLSLLDGRLKQLTTFIVNIGIVENHSMVFNSDDLPNMKCFSLTYDSITYEYDTQVVPLLRRMCNLEQLTLHLYIDDRTRFVDGTQLHNDILIHMPRLDTFIFCIRTITQIVDSVLGLSNEDIRRTFTKAGYEQVECILRNSSTVHTMCHVFSLPFAFHRLEMVCNNFPNIIFKNVTFLWVQDAVPFKHEFFIRITQCFPLLKSLSVVNFGPQISDLDVCESDNDQSHSVNNLYSPVEYPYITTLDIMYAHIDYVEQLLHESKTHLPRLTELKIKYDRLQKVTKNFTRDATRLNCRLVKWLVVNVTAVNPKDFYIYFPLL